MYFLKLYPVQNSDSTKELFCFSYVDSHRMASVQLSSESGGDLKKAMAKHGMKVP